MLTLHDIMTVDVETVRPESTLAEAFELLSEQHISGVPVVSGGHVVGVVSLSDLVDYQAARRLDAVEAPVPASGADRSGDGEDDGGEDPWDEDSASELAYFTSLESEVPDRVLAWWRAGGIGWDDLEDHAVAEIMTRKLVSYTPDTPVRKAARGMLEAGVHRVLVMEGASLKGVVTTFDILKAVSQYGLSG